MYITIPYLVLLMFVVITKRSKSFLVCGREASELFTLSHTLSNIRECQKRRDNDDEVEVQDRQEENLQATRRKSFNRKLNARGREREREEREACSN